jgi:hypothetical protein
VGLLKNIKDAKKAVEAAPGLVSGAMQMKEQAEQMAAAQQAAAQQAAATAQPASDQAAAAGGPDYEPIAGVSLEQFAEICKGLAAHGYDQAKGTEVAASKGVSADGWRAALDGWNERIKNNATVAQRFNRFYVGS